MTLNKPKIQIVIPMAGRGSRFAEAGYTDPKPLIPVGNNKRMIEVVINNIKPKDEVYYYFITQRDHTKEYGVRKLLRQAAEPSGCFVHAIDGITEGAACTVMEVAQYINNEDPVIIANSDQWMDFDINEFITKAEAYDGYILTMEAANPKWSFVGRDANGKIDRVAEKQPISNEATCGVYWFKKGSDLVKAAQDMFKANDRFNNEFYLAPVYNYLMKNGGIVETMKIDDMHGMGTPEDLEKFKKSLTFEKATKF